jgi:hypothetical protein
MSSVEWWIVEAEEDGCSAGLLKWKLPQKVTKCPKVKKGQISIKRSHCHTTGEESPGRAGGAAISDQSPAGV